MQVVKLIRGPYYLVLGVMMLQTISQVKVLVGAFLKDEDGPTAVEYAVMLALIIVVCIAAVTTLGTNSNNTFSYVGKRVGSTGS
jgi:pilus assembly protein Flp/PilA